MGRLASRYAQALFELAVENDSVDKSLGETETLKEALYSDGEIREFIKNPNLSSEDKFNILKNTLEGNVSDDVLGLLAVVFSKNRENELLGIFEVFAEMVNQKKGIVTALVESAVPLDDSQLDEIKNKLSKNLNKQIVIKTRIEPGLIGGLKISADGHVIDGTIKRSLDELKRTLLENRLA